MAKRIHQFLKDVLNALPRNPRWSWGASDEQGRLFLFVWDHHLSRDGNRIKICWKEYDNNSPGFAERVRHTALLRDGKAQAFGILCTGNDHDSSDDSRIGSFNDETLLQLGTVTISRGITYAEIVARVPVSEILSISNPSNPQKLILRGANQATVQEALRQARLGQGWFRTAVLGAWGNRCAVTGSSVLEAVRASHVKCWSNSNDTERLDPNNGLPLVANLDALFDRGLISFDQAGEMLVSPRLDVAERQIFGLDEPQKLLRSPNRELLKYLAWHRRHLFQT
jgi:hypothetical protein